MAPRVRHVYQTRNRRFSGVSSRSTRPFLGDDSSSSFLTSYSRQSDAAFRSQHEELVRMRSQLQERERKILQDITNFKSSAMQLPVRIASESAGSILPSDINVGTVPLAVDASFAMDPMEHPSFVASPVVFAADDKTEDAVSEVELTRVMKDASFIDESAFSAMIGLAAASLSISSHDNSSSPNKVPGSSDIPDLDGILRDSEQTSPVDERTLREERRMERPVAEEDVWHFVDAPSEGKSTHDEWTETVPRAMQERESDVVSVAHDGHIAPFDDPIEAFSIDPDYLRDFAGLWRRTLAQPIVCENPASPDHFPGKLIKPGMKRRKLRT